MVAVGSCATTSAETSNSHFLVLHLDTAQKRLALDCARAASYCLFRRHRKKAESSVSATASPVFGSSASAWRDGHGATMTGQRPSLRPLCRCFDLVMSCRRCLRHLRAPLERARTIITSSGGGGSKQGFVATEGFFLIYIYFSFPPATTTRLYVLVTHGVMSLYCAARRCVMKALEIAWIQNCRRKFLHPKNKFTPFGEYLVPKQW